MRDREGSEACGAARLNNYDMLRVLSAIAVIIIHVNWEFFGARAKTPSMDICYLAESAINIVTRFSVPCFVMLSGAFNLRDPRNRSFSHFYRKTLWKIFLPVALAIILFTLWDAAKAAYLRTGILSAVNLPRLLTGGKYRLWFMYMLAGLYLLTPLIVRLKETLSRGAGVTASVLLLVWAVGSQALSSQRAAYAMGVVFAYLGYYLMGDVLMNRVELKHRPALYFSCAGVMFLLAFAARYLGATRYLSNAYTSFFSPFITMASLCIFAGVKGLHIRKNWSWLAGKTFYIYLFHNLVYQELLSLMDRLEFPVHELIRIPVVTAAAFGLSLVLAVLYTLLWQKMNPLKQKLDAWPFWDRLDG